MAKTKARRGSAQRGTGKRRTSAKHHAPAHATPQPPEFDLFGDPVPANWGRPGRPQHIATQHNRDRVNMMLALGWSNERIASALGVSQPTLRKAYAAELRQRGDMRDRLDIALAMRLWQEVMAGNVSAMREFRTVLDRNDLMLGRGDASPPPSPDKEPKLGKKEQLQRDAERGAEATVWSSLLN